MYLQSLHVVKSNSLQVNSFFLVRYVTVSYQYARTFNHTIAIRNSNFRWFCMVSGKKGFAKIDLLIHFIMYRGWYINVVIASRKLGNSHIFVILEQTALGTREVILHHITKSESPTMEI